VAPLHFPEKVDIGKVSTRGRDGICVRDPCFYVSLLRFVQPAKRCPAFFHALVETSLQGFRRPMGGEKSGRVVIPVRSIHASMEYMGIDRAKKVITT